MSHFEFLNTEWPSIYEASAQAESLAKSDPRSACFHARRALELTVHWMYRHDSALRIPYTDNLSALMHEPTFRNTVGMTVFNKAQFIRRLGNLAAHSQKPIQVEHAITTVRELFHFDYWFARTYARGAKPTPGLEFDPEKLPKLVSTTTQSVEQLQRLEAELRERDEKLTQLQADRIARDEELKRLRAEIAEQKKVNQSQPDTHDYSEADTRSNLIDLLLMEAGWPLDQDRDREFEVTGMPNEQGKGYVDYVLWGNDGKPLGIVEAKRTTRDAHVGQQQAKLYADCLEQMYSQRPVIFYSNGYEHWVWDDTYYPPREVQGFYKRSELELMIQRRATRKTLSNAPINEAIVERYYQTRAIRRIGEAFERDRDRKALIVMATGAGKTRTVVALSDMLMRCNWVKRVLFLADRLELVRQAVGAFKTHLPQASPVNLVTEKNKEGRVFVSTYPTMMGLIEKMNDGQRRFGVGNFDLVVIDEAHRSVFHKYKAIFDYFDSLLVGLTATPKDEVDRNTYRLFDLEDRVPTDAYSLEEAVKDQFLRPPKSVSVPLKFQREGIKYDELSDEEKEQWDALEWDEEGEIPDRVDAGAVNKWLFNKDTVDKVLEHLMTRGLKVAGGDRLGKAIIFAKNHAHAQFIAERFDANYPHLKGEFARVIDYQVEYASTLIDDFKNPNKPPHIAISVDMLDTGIDVPEIVNLVFFKLVRSKTKFWQMVGRGTRLCPDLFGPGEDKKHFLLFDYCQNLEFFSQDLPTTEGALAESLGKRLFKTRAELVGELDRHRDDQEVRQDIVELLRVEVGAMNPENFIVRPKRRYVEKYQTSETWAKLSTTELTELQTEVAGLPAELEPEPEEAKRFDLLVLNLQLSLLRAEPNFNRLRDQVRNIAGLLEEQSTIPVVAEQLDLIQDLQTDEWWQDVTVPMLENARKRIRGLVQLIEKTKRKPIYSDFVDELGEEKEVDLSNLVSTAEFERFRTKARAFLREHEDHITIHKVRWNEPLTQTDLEELERMLIEEGVGTPEVLERAKEEGDGFGLFIRPLVGLDKEVAKRAFGRFLSDKNLSSNQIEFINLIIDHLTQNGVMDPALLYESPFTDMSPTGPEGMFAPAQVDDLVLVLHEIRRGAVA